jgi:hypothetical protein
MRFSSDKIWSRDGPWPTSSPCRLMRAECVSADASAPLSMRSCALTGKVRGAYTKVSHRRCPLPVSCEVPGCTSIDVSESHQRKRASAVTRGTLPMELRFALRIIRSTGRQNTMVRTVTRTRHRIVRAAKRGAATVKAAAGEAIGAAAKAATEVVLDSTSAALAAGRARLTRSSPAIKRAAEKTARRSVDKPARRKRAARKRATVRRSRTATARRRRKTRRNSR